MKHNSSLYFDNVVTFLVKTHMGLLLEDIARDLDMTTETLRRKRKGITIPDCRELELLYRKYSINPMYFFGSKELQANSYNTEGRVSEPEAVYQTKLEACEEQNKLLKKMVEMYEGKEKPKTDTKTTLKNKK